jgi:hypothetical protein
MNEHILIIGDPGSVPRILRAQQGPALTMTSLCLTADIPRLPGLTFMDRILATGPCDESSDAWIATAVSAHRASPVTRAAVFDPNAHSRAIAVADVLGVKLYPRLGFTAIGDHWAVRQRLRALGQHFIVSARASDGASLERYIAEHGLPCLLRSRGADRPAVVLRDVGDVDRAVRGETLPAVPGEGMVVEPAPTGRLYRVAVLVEAGRSEALAVLRPESRGRFNQRWGVVAGPAADLGEDDPDTLQLVRLQAAELALTLGVLEGLLLVDLELDGTEVRIGGVRLGLPGERTRGAILGATGVDLTLCCAQQACGQPALDLALDAAAAFAGDTGRARSTGGLADLTRGREVRRAAT